MYVIITTCILQQGTFYRFKNIYRNGKDTGVVLIIVLPQVCSNPYTYPQTIRWSLSKIQLVDFTNIHKLFWFINGYEVKFLLYFTFRRWCPFFLVFFLTEESLNNSSRAHTRWDMRNATKGFCSFTFAATFCLFCLYNMFAIFTRCTLAT